MRSQQDDNNPDLLELKENPHRRAKTYRTSGMTNDAMNTFPSDDDLDLPELKENPHWRAQTSGTSRMTNDTMNTFLMRQEPPQEGTNLRNEQDNKHVPNATNVFLM